MSASRAAQTSFRVTARQCIRLTERRHHLQCSQLPKRRMATAAAPAQASDAASKTAASSSSSKSRAESGSAAKKFQHPPPGLYKAYDEAIKLIKEDSRQKLVRLEILEKQVKKLESSSKEAQSLQKEMQQLQIQAHINDPEIRWNFENGLADLSQPVYRHLRQQQWKKGGNYAILHQRYTQMYITPDVLPTISPCVDFQISFSNDPSLEPGSFIEPQKTLEPPKMEAMTFQPEERSYTLLLVDPDVPDESNQSYATHCHWLITDINISPSSPQLSAGNVIHPYIPSHPHKGTKYHRYALLLLQQSTKTLKLSPDYAESLSSSGKITSWINVRDFVSAHDLECVGVHFWRAEWDRSVSKMYADGVIEGPEPIYGQPKIVQKVYEDLAGRKYENV